MKKIFILFIVLLFASSGWTLTFEQKCAQPGVLVCEGFDTIGELAWTGEEGFRWNNQPYGSLEVAEGNLETVNQFSGTGAVKFLVPDSRAVAVAGDGTGVSGWFRKDFGTDIGEGDTVYISFKYYAESVMRVLTSANTGGAVGYKIFIMHRGDVTYASENEFTMKIDFNPILDDRPHFITGYADGGGHHWYLTEGGTTHYQQGDYYDTCVSGSTDKENCWNPNGDEWVSLYIKLQIGASGIANSYLEGWAKHENGSWEKIFDNPNVTLNIADGGYNSIDILPYMNNRASSGAPTHDATYVMCDELIVSTQPIESIESVRQTSGPMNLQGVGFQ